MDPNCFSNDGFSVFHYNLMIDDYDSNFLFPNHVNYEWKCVHPAKSAFSFQNSCKIFENRRLKENWSENWVILFFTNSLKLAAYFMKRKQDIALKTNMTFHRIWSCHLSSTTCVGKTFHKRFLEIESFRYGLYAFKT